MTRAAIDGKFLRLGDERFLVSGASYGTFAPDANGEQFPSPERIAADFAQMAAAGINTVRTYTPPTEPLLDTAARNGLVVMAGLSWAQHVPFLDDRYTGRRIREDAVREVTRLASHPALLMVAVGNEIPGSIVRWHGHRRVERFLSTLYEDVKAAAPECLFAYVNYPPTEFLHLECFDVCAFNVYLHQEAALRGYLARLQHIAGRRPLLLAEAGADSQREGLDGQARITATHIRCAFEEGACGAVAYAWTDDWWRGGHPVDDWSFGLVDAERSPKPALAAVSQVFRDAPFSATQSTQWPEVSVVVCAYNAADTIDECLTSLAGLTYPRTQIIVINDGSRDDTSAIARRYAGVLVIDLLNGGLSAARNAGLGAATGTIVAYTDADCRVDRDWLTYLVQPLLSADIAGAGGPNVVPADDGWIAQCVARTPGGPTHVMLDDRTAEHVPGCNMAFRREALLAVDGFNAIYLRAGDDVDICWRLQARGLRIGFAPAALVWHRHRNRIGAFWRQQVGYGEGETWLDAHHPEKFLAGHMVWHGRIYSALPFLQTAERRVNTGVWGTAAFPSVYSTQSRPWHYLPHSPVWMAGTVALLLVGTIGPLAGMDAAWLPLMVGVVALGLTFLRCGQFAARSDLTGLPRIGSLPVAPSRWLYRAVIAWLHVIQPLARSRGRFQGLSQPEAVTPQHVTRYPWRTPMPGPRDVVSAVRLVTRGGVERTFWSESWSSHATLLRELVGVLRASRPSPRVDVDEGWRPDRDVSLAIGRWGWLLVGLLVEEHAGGACLCRVRTRLSPSFNGTLHSVALAALLAGGTAASFALYTPPVGITVAFLSAIGIAARTAWQTIRANAVLDRALTHVTNAAGFIRLPLATGAAAAPPAAKSPVSDVGR
ncbi:MAG: glycosyltransferase [Acidobacteria bacterium]|nr:glycosyltransferase [Acidobacteriota bacterium]